MIRILFLAAVAILILPQQLEAESDARAREIVDRVDRLLRGDSSFGVAEVAIVTRRWERRTTLEIWSEGTEKALIRLLKPKKEEGMATLKVGSDI